jgi:hypothetical protein
MTKTTYFFGQSVFGQLISLIDTKIISNASKNCNSDRYVKKFKTKDHLISMLFCAFAKCSSLRIELYIHPLNILENPDKDWSKELYNEEQLSLF